jgi:CAAX prenyl protease-like protein
MSLLRQQLQISAIHARVVPYAIILVLTFVQDGFAGPARYWMYFLKMLVGLWCIYEMRRLVPEARWAFSWEAVVVGILVCVVWVGLDPYYGKVEFLFKAGNPWNPFKQFGEGSGMGYFFFAVRAFGSALVIPPIEEACYRSCLYRYFIRIEFTELPFSRFHWLSFVVTAVIFGFSHYQWLGGVLCGMAFQWLVIRKNRLGDAMTAHAITNFLLALWIMYKGAWSFW